MEGEEFFRWRVHTSIHRGSLQLFNFGTSNFKLNAYRQFEYRGSQLQAYMVLSNGNGKVVGNTYLSFSTDRYMEPLTTLKFVAPGNAPRRNWVRFFAPLSRLSLSLQLLYFLSLPRLNDDNTGNWKRWWRHRRGKNVIAWEWTLSGGTILNSWNYRYNLD